MALRSLQEIQTSLLADIFNAQPDTLQSHIVPIDSAHTRLHVYRNNIQQSFLKTLHRAFPICVMALGARFDVIAKESIALNISDIADLNLYGDFFAGFLSDYRVNSSAEARPLPDFIADLAEAEYALLQCYYAEDSRVFDFSKFSDLSEQAQGEIKLILTPKMQLLKSSWPLSELLNDVSFAAENDIQQSEGGHYFCVHRSEMKAEVIEIPRQSYKALKALSHGVTLHQFSSDTATRESVAALGQWISRGWVAEMAAC
ncbi:MAG: putative DNA-binding domain-containing protein [Pseudomonadales bacterium]|nr:putative DNA-binding domain-containing protein [Pseudomonadales bacterium]